MKTIGFFNSKGGVGKTSLVYHVTWMLSKLDKRVIAVDLDPQANLTSMFVSEERLEDIWNEDPRPTLQGALSPQFRGLGDIRDPVIENVSPDIGLLAGDLGLSRFEDELAAAWPRCHNGDERSFRMMSAFFRAVEMGGVAFGADVALVDVGPNLGPLNRSALLACDHVVVPIGVDLFSLQGLRNMGPALRDWRRIWLDMVTRNPDKVLHLPTGEMNPLGYIVMRHSIAAGRPAQAFGKWMAKIPEQYARYVLDAPAEPAAVTQDPNCIERLKDYRSLMPMAREARKPMFLLKPADGAFGGHQAAVIDCYRDFERLTRQIMQRAGIPIDREREEDQAG